ncbi:hypothetical protein L9F63_011670, partial [Diploptera punctata]
LSYRTSAKAASHHIPRGPDQRPATTSRIFLFNINLVQVLRSYQLPFPSVIVLPGPNFPLGSWKQILSLSANRTSIDIATSIVKLIVELTLITVPYRTNFDFFCRDLLIDVSNNRLSSLNQLFFVILIFSCLEHSDTWQNRILALIEFHHYMPLDDLELQSFYINYRSLFVFNAFQWFEFIRKFPLTIFLYSPKIVVGDFKSPPWSNVLGPSLWHSRQRPYLPLRRPGFDSRWGRYHNLSEFIIRRYAY